MTMKTILIISFMMILIAWGYEQNIEPQKTIEQNSSQNHKNIHSHKPDIIFKEKQQLVQINRISEVKVEIGKIYMFYANFNSLERLNINLYSSEINFRFFYHLTKESDKSKNKQKGNVNQTEALKEEIQLFKIQILKKQELYSQENSNGEYKHFISLNPQKNHLNDPKIQTKPQKTQDLILIAVYIPSSNFNYTFSHSRKQQIQFPITIILTSSQTLISKQSFQKVIYYELTKQQIHTIKINSSEYSSEKSQEQEDFNTKKSSLTLSNKNKNNSSIFSFLSYAQEEQSFVFHNIHLVGDFVINCRYKGYFDNKETKSLQIDEILFENITQSTFQLNKSLIVKKNDELIKRIVQKYKSWNKKQQNQKVSQLYSSQINFLITCISQQCIFLSEIQDRKQIRKIIPGIPYIYFINDFQIFEISNLKDLEISINMNKKNGFPQYQICSIKNNLADKQKKNNQNYCIQELKNQTSTSHLFQVRQKDDKLHALGRNNQIIINTDHEAYCFQCTYFIALYTDYDHVLGMITIKNSQSSVLIPEGNSITKVLKRNTTDKYIFYGLESRMLFEKFSGKFEIFYRESYLNERYNGTQVTNQKEGAGFKPLSIPESLKSEDNYYSIDLKELILESELYQANKSQKLSSTNLKNYHFNKVYQLSLKTQNNYPFIYYSLIIVNNQSRKIILKDGIPFFNKQKNKISVFKYLTENIVTKNFGTIIINSNRISQMGLEIYGNCLAIDLVDSNGKNGSGSGKGNKLTYEKQSSMAKKGLNLLAQLTGLETKKYEMQKIQKKKINYMANRIDIMIEPQMCNHYIIKMINNASDPQRNPITYQILVSFIDSMILPLNNQVPGILQYPGKIIQIYEVFISQKTNLSILINFCRAAKSRMEIYKNLQALYAQNSDKKVIFTSESQLEETVYLAHAGIFYITIEFFGFSNILEYTILLRQQEADEGFYYIDLSKQEQQISYTVKQGRFFSTTFELYFSPIFLKHWYKDAQRDVQIFQTTYFILQSNSYPLLKRASNCKGQFFSDIVNHHEHFKQTKIEKDKLVFHSPQKMQKSKFSHAKYYERGYYSYQYETSNPLSFIIIVPVITHQKKSQTMDESQIFVLQYWKFNKKSRQPYQIMQLTNGKLYSIFQHWFVSALVQAQYVFDFHPYEGIIATMILFFSCLPLTCCIIVCTYRIKVNIEYYCRKLCNFVEKQMKRRRKQSLQLQQRSAHEHNQTNSHAIPTQDQADNISDGIIEVYGQGQEIMSPKFPIRRTNSQKQPIMQIKPIKQEQEIENNRILQQRQVNLAKKQSHQQQEQQEQFQQDFQDQK